MKKVKLFSTFCDPRETANNLNAQIEAWQQDPDNGVLEILEVQLAASERTTIVSVFYLSSN